MKNFRLAIVSIILLLLAGYLFYTKILQPRLDGTVNTRMGIAERTYKNYGKQTAIAAKKYNLSQEYLLALIALECSGRKIIPHRFESHVYRKLKRVKSGNLKSMEKVTHNGIKAMSDDAIKNLARSWGPYQIMGYKVFEIGVKIEDLRGKNSTNIGASWINEAYGSILRKENFKDAFHIHNTGRKYPKVGPPKTYNKNYVPKGLSYMAQFRELIQED